MQIPEKPQFIQAELTVSRKVYLTPHYIRIYLTGPQVDLFADTTAGVNNKILIPPEGVEKVHFPTYDYVDRRWVHQTESLRPVVRTYTHRGMDLGKKEIWIDFIAHGKEGPASAWALSAGKGDKLGVLMKQGKRMLYPRAQHYILVGDATGIPVLAAILEDLPAHVQGTCILEVPDASDEQELHTRANINLIYLHNADPQQGSHLSEALMGLELPGNTRFAYIAAEYASVKQMRQYLRQEQGWKQEELYAYSYWKAGMAEDASAKDRQKEKTQST